MKARDEQIFYSFPVWFKYLSNNLLAKGYNKFKKWNCIFQVINGYSWTNDNSLEH